MTLATRMMLQWRMRDVTLPYIHEFKDRHEKVRRYVRRYGRKIPLRAEPGTPAYLTEYQDAIDLLERGKKSGPVPGTWSALIAEYYGSNKFKKQKPRSQEESRREAERIRDKWGHLPVARVEARHILHWQDELGETPGAANNMLACVKKLLKFGKPRGYRHNDPAAEIEELEIGEYRSWTDAEIAAFEARWSQGTRERLIFDLALYTGQRRSDLVAMTRHHFDGDVMGCVQEKTDERIAIPVHPMLKASIAAFPSSGLAIIQRLDGQGMKVREMYDVFASAMRAALGEKTDCVLHGLRYAAARCLAEAGATTQEIMAVTGHRSLEMVEKYTREANKVRLAGSAMRKLVLWRTRTERESGYPA